LTRTRRVTHGGLRRTELAEPAWPWPSLAEVDMAAIFDEDNPDGSGRRSATARFQVPMGGGMGRVHHAREVG
jgi:hypothetical protein